MHVSCWVLNQNQNGRKISVGIQWGTKSYSRLWNPTMNAATKFEADPISCVVENVLKQGRCEGRKHKHRINRGSEKTILIWSSVGEGQIGT